MVNEEDHLRLQVMRSGFALDEGWQQIDRVDDLLEQRISYAFSDDFGYLTACPTNVGTGMRASVMLHLPALEYTKQIEKVFRALQKINLAVRGLYGEGSRASGHFYQISNQVTLGKSETTVLNEIHGVIPQIITYERQARASWLRDNRQGLQDKVSRAHGTLCSATMMTSEETMELLSYVRLGVNLGLLNDLTIPTINELFIHTQPAHLQKLMGSALDGEERNAARRVICAPASVKRAPTRIDPSRFSPPGRERGKNGNALAAKVLPHRPGPVLRRCRRPALRPAGFLPENHAAVSAFPPALVYVSGFFEILGGVGLLVRPLRRAAGYGLLALLVAVFPANIQMAVDTVGSEPGTVRSWIAVLRLPLQVPLLLWVYWCMRDRTGVAGGRRDGCC